MTTWNIDTAHSAVNFAVKHMMVTTVRGSFSGVVGVIAFDPQNPAASSVEVEIDAASIYTGILDRDNHLRSGDFFDAENHPKVTFKSSKVELRGESSGKISGDLTIRGITRPVVLDVEFLGEDTAPWGETRIGFEASTKINREDWNLTWNQALESGGVLVGKEVRLSIDVQAARVVEAEAQAAFA